MTEAQEASTETLGEALEDIMRRAEALLEATAGATDARVREARERLDARLAAAKHKYQTAGANFKETVAATDRFVREKPYQAVAGGVLAGLLLGWLLRGR